MNIRTEKLSKEILLEKPTSYINRCEVMFGEIEGVAIEYISMRGQQRITNVAASDHYDVLLSLNGNAKLDVLSNEYSVSGSSIVKMPYDAKYSINVDSGQDFNGLLIRKSLSNEDRKVIMKDKVHHHALYHKALSECPTYRERIKSEKTVNRMILPDGMVPRFCMGSVETVGPDEVRKHTHAMLDQLFFGLADCNCTCYADGEETILTENTILHIPLGSSHSVSVSEGNKLTYIWMDFFLTLKDEKYMGEQHQVDD